MLSSRRRDSLPEADTDTQNSPKKRMLLHATPPEIYLQVHIPSRALAGSCNCSFSTYLLRTGPSRPPNMAPRMRRSLPSDRSDGGAGDHLGSGCCGGEMVATLGSDSLGRLKVPLQLQPDFIDFIHPRHPGLPNPRCLALASHLNK